MGSGETRGTWWRLRQVRRHLGGKGNETLTLCRQARTDGGGDRPVGGGFMAVAAKERQGLCWRRMPQRAQSARHAAPRQQVVAPKMHAMNKKHMPKMHASPCACNCRVRTQCSPRAWVQHHGLAPVYEPGLSCTRATIRVMRRRGTASNLFHHLHLCVGTGATCHQHCTRQREHSCTAVVAMAKRYEATRTQGDEPRKRESASASRCSERTATERGARKEPTERHQRSKRRVLYETTSRPLQKRSARVLPRYSARPRSAALSAAQTHRRVWS